MDDCGLKTQFVEPVEIRGKWFEKSDIQSLARETIAVLKRGFNKPKEAKQRHAKFVLECLSRGLAHLPRVDVSFIKRLADCPASKKETLL